MEGFKIEKENHTGNAYKLSMKCLVNGVDVCEGNLADMDWTFAELIQRCSYGVQLFPGDIISSGLISTGSFLQLNNAGRLNDPHYKEQWLKEEDIVEIEIENLGKLINKIAKDEGDSLISEEYNNVN
jgi:fumarylacetoacetate (FAA) hydrolase